MIGEIWSLFTAAGAGYGRGKVADWDPLAPKTLEDPLGTHAELRRACPVAWSDQFGGFWALFKYDDVMAAARDSETFISSIQVNIPSLQSQPRIPLQSDPPEHTFYRKLLQTYFHYERLPTLEPRIRAVAAELLQPLIAAGRGDAYAELTYPLPSRVLCYFLHLPEQDHALIKTWTAEISAGALERDQARLGAGSKALEAYIADLVDQRTAEPDPENDVTSGLLAAGLPLDLVAGCVRLLLSAGHETTTGSLGIILHYLARNPDIQTRLRDDLSLIASAVDEILRWESPVQRMGRTLSRDVELHGRQLKQGDRLALMFGSANRDEAAFTDAEQCQIGRSPNRHVVFGYGRHKCIGEGLARLELRIAVEEVLVRTHMFMLDGPIRRERWQSYGITRLPLRFEVA
ncbi:MAG: cytochrome P450 [Chloroflexi bacterium]|nr:cytochrome P450 [Chloroflexota bacterium]